MIKNNSYKALGLIIIASVILIFNSFLVSATVGDALVPTMSSDSLPVPYVTWSSPYAATFNPYKAFNGAGTWYRSTSHTCWLAIDMGSAKVSNVIYMKAFDANSAFKDYTIKGSNDNSTWSTLSTITGQANSFDGNGIPKFSKRKALE